MPAIAALLVVASLIIVRRSYSALAKKYGKDPGGYVALGLLTYVAGVVALIAVLAFTGIDMGKKYDGLAIILVWLFGCFCSGFLYFRLKGHWEDGNPKNDNLLDR